MFKFIKVSYSHKPPPKLSFDRTFVHSSLSAFDEEAMVQLRGMGLPNPPPLAIRMLSSPLRCCCSTILPNLLAMHVLLLIGLVSKLLLPGRWDGVVKAALELAGIIASKGPVTIASAKRTLLHARDNAIAANLEYTSVWNVGMLDHRNRFGFSTAAHTTKCYYAKIHIDCNFIIA